MGEADVKKEQKYSTPKYFSAGYAHSFPHMDNTDIFQGKLTEVKEITNEMVGFPLKLVHLKHLNILVF